MATDNLTIKFKGVDEVSPVVKKIQGDLSSFGASAANVAKGALAAVAVGAAAVAAELYTSAKAAMEAEENLQRLKKALENSGEATQKNLDALIEQSAALQSTTKYSDDAVQSMQALAINMGASTEEALKITTAATDMASALGIDADQATRALSLSMEGNITQLGKLIPEVKDLTEEQLANGDAIAIVAKRYKGFAENEGRTLTGTLTRIGNAFGDLQEEIGSMFTDNAGLTRGLNDILPVFERLKELVSDNKDTMRDLVVYGLSGLVKSLGFLAQGGVVVTDMFLGLSEGIAKVNLFAQKMNNFLYETETSLKNVADAQADLRSVENVRKDFQEFGTTIFGITEQMNQVAEAMGAANYETKQVSASTQTYSSKVRSTTSEVIRATSAVWDYNDAVNEQAEMMDFINSTSLQATGASAQQAATQSNKWAGIAGPAGSLDIGGVVATSLAVAMPGIGNAIAAGVAPAIELLTKGNRAAMDEFFRNFGEQLGNAISNIDDMVASLITNIDNILVSVLEGVGKLAGDTGSFIKDMFRGDVQNSFIQTGIAMADAFGFNIDRFMNSLERKSSMDEVKMIEQAVKLGWMSEGDAGARLIEIHANMDREATRLTEGQQYWNQIYGRRAFGGPVTAGVPYIVGDGKDGSMANAEVFVPSKSGTIMPKDDGGSTQITVNIPPSDNPRVTSQLVLQAMKYLVDTKAIRFDPIRNMAVA